MVYPNRVVLNINQKYVMPIPYTQQGDTARVLTFNILDKGVPFNLTGKTVRAKILKPDNTKCYNDLTITNATGGECDLKLTNQVLAVAGKVNCQLEIKEGEELLSTIIFPIDVEPSIDINGAVESTNEFTALLNGIIKLDEWDKYFKETSGAIEEKYTERLSGLATSLEETKIQVNNKVEKVEGKELSTNDYTNEDKTEVLSIKNKATKQELEVERARINQLTKLQEGSTTGDAELIDARVGADGKTYDNVGNAIREQFENVNTDINALLEKSKNLICFDVGTIKDDGIIKVVAESKNSILKVSQNGQNTSNVYAVIKRFTNLEIGKSYTFGINKLSGTYVSSGAINIGVYRTDNNAPLGTILNFADTLQNGTNKSMTFIAEHTSIYIQITYASTGALRNYDCNINFSLVEGNLPSYKDFNYVDINKNLPTMRKVVNIIKNNYDIIVAKDGTGDFTSLSTAVTYANQFDRILVKRGYYDNEVVKAWLKTLYIIGEDPFETTITNKTGEYLTPPVEMGTGLLEGLTIYARNENSITPSNKGYALHAESSVTNSKNFTIKDCIIKSDWRQSFGMGMRGNMNYNIKNTEFLDGVYFHDCEHDNALGEQNISFCNCIITRKDNSAALLLQSQQKPTSFVNVDFTRCLIKGKSIDVLYKLWDAKNNNVIDVDSFAELGDYWKMGMKCWGNSLSDFNL